MLIRYLILGIKDVGKASLLSSLRNRPGVTENKNRNLTVGELKVQVCSDSYTLPKIDEASLNQSSFPESDVILDLAQEADCIFFVYRVSNQESFNSIELWMQSLNEKLSCPSMVLVGNSSDLPAEQVSMFFSVARPNRHRITVPYARQAFLLIISRPNAQVVSTATAVALAGALGDLPFLEISVRSHPAEHWATLLRCHPRRLCDSISL
jgi:GTPase SAR1 family protein